MEINWWGK